MSRNRYCKNCGDKHLAKGMCQKCYDSHPDRVAKRLKYSRSQQGIEYHKKYRNQEIVKYKNLEYSRSARAKRLRKLYEKKPEVRERISNYNKSPIGKAIQANESHRRRLQKKVTDITTSWLLDLSNKTTICSVCNKKLGDKRHLDHIKPLNVGGLHVMKNVRYVHCKCNLGRPKDGSDIKEFQYANI